MQGTSKPKSGMRWIEMTHFNHREPGEFGEGATMIRIPKRRGWEITGYAILAWAVIASIFALVLYFV